MFVPSCIRPMVPADHSHRPIRVDTVTEEETDEDTKSSDFTVDDDPEHESSEEDTEETPKPKRSRRNQGPIVQSDSEDLPYHPVSKLRANVHVMDTGVEPLPAARPARIRNPPPPDDHGYPDPLQKKPQRPQPKRPQRAVTQTIVEEPPTKPSRTAKPVVVAAGETTDTVLLQAKPKSQPKPKPKSKSNATGATPAGRAKVRGQPERVEQSEDDAPHVQVLNTSQKRQVKTGTAAVSAEEQTGDVSREKTPKASQKKRAKTRAELGKGQLGGDIVPSVMPKQSLAYVPMSRARAQQSAATGVHRPHDDISPMKTSNFSPSKNKGMLATRPRERDEVQSGEDILPPANEKFGQPRSMNTHLEYLSARGQTVL
ncbi:hypothetical protein BD410DRAFT_845876 [Rickenella mellea]|uniref:Uncharacterized protein n=1 Tax=Rickenella mellea TaxID=50990 RepID=A0A4Y7PGS4_9AGAM|nr:hypothetical protein BD410DRAFT_845876 [Rickenella mellea]